MKLVIFEKVADYIGKITLNDPDNLNAMSPEMAKEFSSLVDEIKKDNTNYRAIILTGAGRAFSAGGDLDMLEKKSELSGEKNRLLMLQFYESFLKILTLNVPLVAAINGHAIGAGLCVASACDIRLASKSAKLGFTFVKLGLHPGMGATYFLPRCIGWAAASELLLTGRVLGVDEALNIGLVSRVVEGEDLMTSAVQIAEEIVSCGPEAVRQVLQSIRTGTHSLKESLEREALCQGINYSSPEFKEGVRAAKEKRKANF